MSNVVAADFFGERLRKIIDGELKRGDRDAARVARVAQVMLDGFAQMEAAVTAFNLPIPENPTHAELEAFAGQVARVVLNRCQAEFARAVLEIVYPPSAR